MWRNYIYLFNSRRFTIIIAILINTCCICYNFLRYFLFFVVACLTNINDYLIWNDTNCNTFLRNFYKTIYTFSLLNTHLKVKWMKYLIYVLYSILKSIFFLINFNYLLLKVGHVKFICFWFYSYKNIFKYLFTFFVFFWKWCVCCCFLK